MLEISVPMVKIRVDGASTKGTTSTSDESYPTSRFGMGSGSTEVDLAEVIAVKGIVSDSDVTRVEAYLKDKYKFTF